MKSHPENRSRRRFLSWSFTALLAVLFALATPGRSLAGPGENEPPELGRIIGRVVAGDRPVPDAHVALVNAAGVVVRRAVSNDAGEFGFRDLRPGRYVVRAEKRDVGVGRAEIALRPGETARARIMLRRP